MGAGFDDRYFIEIFLPVYTHTRLSVIDSFDNVLFSHLMSLICIKSRSVGSNITLFNLKFTNARGGEKIAASVD